MNRRRRWIGVLLVGCATAALVRSRAEEAQVPGAAAKADGSHHLVGSPSCSARACHGSLEAHGGGTVLRNEHATWLLKDKHSKAYDVLLNDRSKTIARNLGIADAAKDERCLACHSVPLAVADEAKRADLLSDGVSCEACHGPAEHWLAAHTTEAWKKLSPAEKQERGLWPTKPLAARAELCAGCHVGAPARDGWPARDCNHDIMAAGHPRINFEFGAFHANMPHHWEERGPEPTFQARAWAVGQAASAKATADLLAHRAEPANKAPWPEFAEYDCFACHHGLSGANWRQKAEHYKKPGNRVPGSIPWGEWYLTGPEFLAAAGTTPDAEVTRALKDLTKTMSAPLPPRDRAAKAARVASGELGRWLSKVEAATLDEAALAKLRKGLAAGPGALAPSSWDSAGQFYLAARALQQAHLDALKRDGKQPGQREQDVDKALEGLAEQLAFPEFKADKVLGAFESPAGFRRDDQFDKALDAVVKLLGQ